MSTTSTQATALSTDALLAHWQGHRRLTRRVIEAFPEQELATFAVAGMRPFGAMAMEMLVMGEPMVRGAATGEWDTPDWAAKPLPKAELLRRWDEASAGIDAIWPTIPAERFAETMTAFGQYTDRLHNLLLYVIDNEIHHRGQGYVYLRSLGIEPPPFWVRE